MGEWGLVLAPVCLQEWGHSSRYGLGLALGRLWGLGLGSGPKWSCCWVPVLEKDLTQLGRA